jgi:hypothetical protein
MDPITVPTYEQIEVMLTKLATNYSNLAILFYDIFYNTTPMDVTFQMFDESGLLHTYTIPNRAKDMNNILNSDSAEVSGSPEGQVEAGRGVIFQDLTNGDLYIKKTSSGSVGWTKFLTSNELQKLIMTGVVSPEGSIAAAKGTLYVDRTNATLYMKVSASGSEGWEKISVNTEGFVTRDDFTNLERDVATKEDGANKVIAISSESTDTEFPSARAVYTYVVEETSTLADVNFSNISNTAKDKFANKDLSNITSDARNQFIDKGRLYNCVLEAPNPMIVPGNNLQDIVLKNGTKLLCTESRNEDGTFNNVIATINDPQTGGIEVAITLPNEKGYIFYSEEINRLDVPTLDEFIITETEPTIKKGVWFDPVRFTYHVVVIEDQVEKWAEVSVAEVGRWSTDSLGKITVEERRPYMVATEEDVAHVVVETGGTDDNWYRLYQDGWIEAGGYGTGNTTIALNKNFKSARFTFVALGVTSYTKAVDSVTVVASGDFDWMAKGWSDEEFIQSSFSGVVHEDVPTPTTTETTETTETAETTPTEPVDPSNIRTLTVRILDSYCRYLSLNGTEVPHNKNTYTYNYAVGTIVNYSYQHSQDGTRSGSITMDEDRTLSIGYGKL